MPGDGQEPGSHAPQRRTACDYQVPAADLLAPLTIRGTTFRNRIVMSPMRQFCAAEGLANDWHLVHLGSRAVGGVGLVLVEATAVTRDGRETAGDLGLWSDEQVEPLARIARFVKTQGAVPGIQLAHAGRKGGCAVPIDPGRSDAPADEGWPLVAPSPLAFGDGDPVPRELSHADIARLIADFEAAARRALAAGFEVLELHAGDGGLLHEFLSPLSNHRVDAYGGTPDDRLRLTRQVAERLRAVWPDHLPLFVRISATDWTAGGWDLEQSILLCRELAQRGVDLVDVSSGGLTPHESIPLARGYQVPFARRIRHEAGVRTGAVGLITDPRQADEIITAGDADLILLGRALLRSPYWALEAAQELGQEPSWPTAYAGALLRRGRGRLNSPPNARRE